MNENKLKKLFEAARKETPPMPPVDFDGDVMRAIRNERRAPRTEASSMFDTLGVLFPRIATAAALVIVLCVAADFGLSAANGPDLSDGIVAISEQWLFAVN